MLLPCEIVMVEEVSCDIYRLTFLVLQRGIADKNFQVPFGKVVYIWVSGLMGDDRNGNYFTAVIVNLFHLMVHTN